MFLGTCNICLTGRTSGREVSMALISVSELLVDADFADPVTVLRQVETVDDDGMVQLVQQRINLVAVVQSMSGEELALLPDLARAEGTMEILTTFPLAIATDSTAADEVIWGNKTYTVISIARFGNYGSQYEGVMALKNVTGRIGPP